MPDLAAQNGSYTERCSNGGLYFPLVYNLNFPAGDRPTYRVQHGIREDHAVTLLLHVVATFLGRTR